MLVLRFTTKDAEGRESVQEVRSARDEILIGSDPTADITMPGMAAEAARLAPKDGRIEVRILPTGERVGRTMTLAEGESFEVDGFTVELAGIPAVETPSSFVFGGYDDDPDLPSPSTFELADTRELADTPKLADTTPVPRADATTPAPAPTHKPTPPPKPTPKPQPTVAQTKPAASKPSRAKPPAPKPPARKKAPELTAAEKAALLKPVKFQDPSFGEALVTQMRRAPFFAVSIAFHTLLFLILMLFDTTQDERPLDDGPGAIVASMSAEEEELAVEVPELEDDLGLPQLPSDMPDLPEEIDVEPTPEKDKQPPETPSPFREDMEFLEQREQETVDIGLMPGLVAASNSRLKRRPKMPKLDLKKSFTKGAAGSVNNDSAQIVRAQLGAARKGNAAKLSDLEADDILVVAGSFDHIHKVLDMLRIKYVKKSPWALFTPKLENFEGYKAVFWNCGESMGEQRTRAICKRLQKYVRNGGYLFTTDWGVATVLQYAFPGYLRTNGNRAHLPEMVLPIEANRSAADHPLLEGVFHRTAVGKWWLEQASFDITVGRKDAVTVLIDSPMLKSQFNRSPIVAATFHYGRGRVLHTMGHYYQEAGNLAGTLSAHRIALNFVLMRLDQDRGSSRRNGRR